jgi:hypothetical protein
MIDGCLLIKGSLAFINVRDWYLRDVLPTGEGRGLPRLEEHNPTGR